VKIRAIALNTLSALVRSRILILLLILFACVLLLMTSPLLIAKAMASQQQGKSLILTLVATIQGMVSGFGSLLAAWASADAIASEMKAGTVLAVMARPIRRWEFLLGKYLGVQILMVIYVLCTLALAYLLAWMGGERLVSSPWMLVVYPLVRYAFYSAIAMFLATMVHPVVALGAVLFLSVAASVFANPLSVRFFPGWLKSSLHAVLPSMGLLAESRFLALKSSPLKIVPWSEHLTALAYGLDWALVFFLLAAWVFRRRSLTRTT
jgi:ABC-type transport system involved in multi-copper enzyme maturation permease subunit